MFHFIYLSGKNSSPPTDVVGDLWALLCELLHVPKNLENWKNNDQTIVSLVGPPNSYF